jgi:4-alpha-glucanotransferase
MDIFRIEGMHKTTRDIDTPAGFWECEDLEEQKNLIDRNLRAILQLFNVKVFILPERI